MQLLDYRFVQDPVADEFVEANFGKPNLEGQSFHSAVTLFSIGLNLPPLSPVEAKALRKAHRFFEKHKGGIFLSLGFLSLPYCYAAKSGVQTLYLSDRFRNQTKQRLEETARFVETALLLGFPDQEEAAKRSIISVRLGHAMFRRSVKSRIPKEAGRPINQEDMAGTQLAFSFLVLRGLRRLGHEITIEDANHWLEAWKTIGRWLGVDDALMATHQEGAFKLCKEIEDRNFVTCMEGRDLTQKLIVVLGNYLKSQKEAEKLLFFMLGEKVSGILGLEPQKIEPTDIVKWKTISWIPDLEKLN
jgi:hypothetical protein